MFLGKELGENMGFNIFSLIKWFSINRSVGNFVSNYVVKDAGHESKKTPEYSKTSEKEREEAERLLVKKLKQEYSLDQQELNELDGPEEVSMLWNISPIFHNRVYLK